MKPYYDDGRGIVIYHGDNREVEILAWDVELTDPPYGVRYKQPRTQFTIRGDDAWRFQRPTKPFVVWGANNSPDYPDCGWLVWDKKRYGGDLFGDGELAATSERKGIHIFGNRWSRDGRDGYTGTHPTEKPCALMEWCIGFLPDGLILDRFMGTGATLVAARTLGRKAIGIEIEERYCEIAAERLSQEVLSL